MRKVIAWIVVALLVLIGAAIVAYEASPWPGAMVIRYLFELDGRARAANLETHAPKDVVALTGIPYGEDGDARLDVYFPAAIEGTTRTLPAIVWIHGGGWVSGSRSDVAGYLKILANRGYTAVAVGYSLAPERNYPTPVRQVNEALGYLLANAEALHADASRFILAGDSAGAQIAAEVANLIAVPSYAETVGVVPAIERSRLAAMVLYCGPYQIRTANLGGIFGPFARTVLWAYIGARDFVATPAFSQISVQEYVTSAFPPTFISAGNGDPLAPSSVAFAEVLAGKGVRVETAFYPADLKPALPHEYQFYLDRPEARTALEQSLEFLANEVPRD